MIKFHEHGFNSDNILACSSTIEVIKQEAFILCNVLCALSFSKAGPEGALKVVINHRQVFACG